MTRIGDATDLCHFARLVRRRRGGRTTTAPFLQRQHQNHKLHVTAKETALSSASKRKLLARKQISARQKVQAHRERLRRQGLRPIQVWVPDTRSATFAAEASRQSRRVAASRYAAKDQAFIDAIAIGGDE
jgi:hypothetical protein